MKSNHSVRYLVCKRSKASVSQISSPPLSLTNILARIVLVWWISYLPCLLTMAELLPIYFSVIAFFCALGAMALAIFHIYRHLLNYTEPTYQRYIVRIIFMVPVCASLLSHLLLLYL
ncbi:hypothetical protein NC651_029489 [Populus alba x Populus x berolinensis]|nr:hypothetical protein NC651_029489 [Populus alba x Populus x berolinensis]